MKEKYRSFSFYKDNKKNNIEDNIEDNNKHLELIKIQLEIEKNLIKRSIYLLDQIITVNVYNFVDYFIFDHYKYDINDVLKIKQQKNNPQNYEYYLSICPIEAFILKNKKIFIANQYCLKFENGNFNIFYDTKHEFERLLNKPNLKEKIKEFNSSGKIINAGNYKNIIENMKNIFNYGNNELEDKSSTPNAFSEFKINQLFDENNKFLI